MTGWVEKFDYPDGPLPSPWDVPSGHPAVSGGQLTFPVDPSYNAIAKRPLDEPFKDMHGDIDATAGAPWMYLYAAIGTGGVFDGIMYYFHGSSNTIELVATDGTSLGALIPFTFPVGFTHFDITLDRDTYTLTLYLGGVEIRSDVIPEQYRYYFDETSPMPVGVGGYDNGTVTYPSFAVDNISVNTASTTPAPDGTVDGGKAIGGISIGGFAKPPVPTKVMGGIRLGGFVKTSPPPGTGGDGMPLRAVGTMDFAVEFTGTASQVPVEAATGGFEVSVGFTATATETPPAPVEPVNEAMQVWVALSGDATVTRDPHQKNATTWSLDESQAMSFTMDWEATADLTPAIVPPPDALQNPDSHMVRQVSVKMKSLPSLVLGRPDQWVIDQTIDKPAGRYRIVAAGKDVTFFRGSDTIVQSLSTVESFGPETAVVKVTGITPFEVLGEGALSWLRDGVNLEIDWVLAGSNQIIRLWEGWIASHEDSIDDQGISVVLQCAGVMLQGDYIDKQPDFDPSVKDIGWLLSHYFNRVPGRRYAAMNSPKTGIEVAIPGAWQALTDWGDEVLAQSTTDDGLNQYAVTVDRGRVPILRLKDMATPHWHVTFGAPGVQVDVSRDITQAPNVYYGSGTDAKGRYWSNQRFPNLHWGPVPKYFFNDLSRIADIGTTDADTVTGEGISDFQRQMNAQGYKVAVTGVFTQELWDAVNQACKDMGLNPGGSVGPHTFSGIYEVGTVNAGAFNDAYHAPLARDPRVDPYTYSASGAITGKNPHYDPTIIRVEHYDQYPDGTTKAMAIKSAERQLARDADPGYVGTITLVTDPEEGPKALVRAGQNIVLRHHRGVDRLFHVSRAEMNEDNQMVLTVDTKGRDYLTLAAIIERNKNAIGPQRRKHLRKKTDLVSTRPAFDYESPAGIIRRHPVNGDAGLWTVIRVPIGWTGDVVKMRYTSSHPAAKFALGVFTQPVTSDQMAALVGNPFEARTDYYTPWTKNAQALDDLGMVYAVGGPGQACGYWPSQETGDDGTATGHPITGEFRDDAGFSFDTTEGTPPYIYVAEYTGESCYLEGRMYCAPTDF